MIHWESLFAEHLRQVQGKTEAILQVLALDGLVIDAGSPVFVFEDDHSYPFRPNHHFAHWTPAKGEKHLLHIRPGQKPRLLYFTFDDYWFEPKDLGQNFWTSQFDVTVYNDEDKLWAAVSGLKNTAYHGPRSERAAKIGLKVDVPTLLERLNWERCYKSDYEVKCLEEATRIAALGHNAAQKEFERGGSGFDIHMAYLTATRQSDRELPYNNIIALNEKACYLHYEDKLDHVRDAFVLLIDAGANYNFYGSDITRTHATHKAPAEFRAMLHDVDAMQQDICAAVRVGLNFKDLNQMSHIKIGELLLRHGVLQGVTAEEAFERGFTRAFFPHGIGHMLGIFVHDVGGRQIDAQGTISQPHPKHPYLRATRSIEERHLFTIEPGIYFIDMLLKPLRASSQDQGCFNWALIDRLSPCGGIRIEDNILVTHQGIQNLTRPYLP